eukprot:4706749-Pyramimonas_sp.AAC.1
METSWGKLHASDSESGQTEGSVSQEQQKSEGDRAHSEEDGRPGGSDSTGERLTMNVRVRAWRRMAFKLLSWID